MFEIEWDAHHDDHTRRRNPYRSKASTIHGWVTKLRGTLLDNEAIRRQGIREMRDAKHRREYRKQRKAQRKARGEGGFLSFFRSSRSLKKRPSQNSRAVVIHRDGSRHHHHRSHKGKQPFMHFPHRTKPSHHGKGTMIRGYVTGNKGAIQRGKQMQHSAESERKREKRRREKRRDREARAMRRR